MAEKENIVGKHTKLRKLVILLAIIGMIFIGTLGIRYNYFSNRLGESYQPEAYDVVGVSLLVPNGCRLEWHPDGESIIYDMIDEDMGIVEKEPVFNIFSYNLTTGTSTRLIPTNISELPRNRGNPALSPDGDWLVFQGEYADHNGYRIWADPGKGKFNNIWIMNISSAELFQITEYADKLGALHPHFDKSGARLTWTHLYSEAGITGSWKIMLADFSVVDNVPTLSNIVSLKPGADLDDNKIFYETHGFSPDGSKLIFTSDITTGAMGLSEIFTYDLNTEELVQLTQSIDCHDEHAMYSPDGKKISWISNMQAQFRWGHTDLFIMDSDGNNQKLLVESPNQVIADNSWCPDGSKLAFYDLRGRITGIYLVTFNF